MSDPLQFFMSTTPGLKPAGERPRPQSSESFADLFQEEVQEPKPRTEVLGEMPSQPALTPPLDPVVVHRGPGQNRDRMLYTMPGHPLTPHGMSYHPVPPAPPDSSQP